MRTAYITIGRNVTGFNRSKRELYEEDWESFRKDLLRLGATFGDIVTQGTVEGIWEGETEESFIIAVSLFNDDEGLLRMDLRRELGILAGKYWQEAIALTIAEPEFVRSLDII